MTEEASLVLEILRKIQKDQAEDRRLLLGLADQNRALARRFNGLEQRMGGLEQRMNSMVDDLEVMLKAEIMGFQTVLRRDIEDMIDERMAARPRLS